METIIETMWKPIVIFKEKTLLLLVTVFLASEKQFFSIYQIFLAVKTVFQSSGNVFFNEFFIPASGNSILLFRALLKFLKFGGSNFFKKNLLPACVN